jgi:PPP family 3-phenylpropionic acid transporter
MLYAHSVFYTFFSLYLEAHGYGKGAIGLIWAVGVVAEIAMFYLQRPLFVRFSAPSLLGFSVAVAAIRFALVGASDGALWLLLLTQLLHAITFGLHHTASQALLSRWFGAERQASAQALYVTVGYGLGGMIGGLGASWIWVAISPAAAFYGAGAVAALGCIAVWWCVRADRKGAAAGARMA